MPVRRRHGMSRSDDEQQYHRHLHHHDQIVEVRRLLDADDQQRRDDKDNKHRWQIEDRYCVTERRRVRSQGFDLIQ
jgi:hypothetical protein